MTQVMVGWFSVFLKEYSVQYSTYGTVDCSQAKYEIQLDPFRASIQDALGCY